MGRRAIDTIRSPYLGYLLHPPKTRKLINRAIKEIPDIEYDSIAFQGMSGAILAPFLALKLKKNLIMVRKAGENSHSCYPVEGFTQSKKYIIVDDFVDTGKTAANIYFTVKNFSSCAKCVGVLAVADGKNGNEPEFIPYKNLVRLYYMAWNRRKKEEPSKKVKP